MCHLSPPGQIHGKTKDFSHEHIDQPAFPSLPRFFVDDPVAGSGPPGQTGPDLDLSSGQAEAMPARAGKGDRPLAQLARGAYLPSA